MSEISLKTGLTPEEMSQRAHELLGFDAYATIEPNRIAHLLVERIRLESGENVAFSERLAYLAQTERGTLRDLWLCAAVWYREEFDLVLLQVGFEQEVENACIAGLFVFLETRKITTFPPGQIELLMQRGLLRPDPTVLLVQPGLEQVLDTLWERTAGLMRRFIETHPEFVHDLIRHGLNQT